MCLRLLLLLAEACVVVAEVIGAVTEDEATGARVGEKGDVTRCGPAAMFVLELAVLLDSLGGAGCSFTG